MCNKQVLIHSISKLLINSKQIHCPYFKMNKTNYLPSASKRLFSASPVFGLSSLP